jgi:hypothetical protein
VKSRNESCSSPANILGATIEQHIVGVIIQRGSVIVINRKAAAATIDDEVTK